MIVPVTYTGTTPTEVVRGAYTYIIVDTHTGLQVGKPYTQRNRARARADRLDNQYGAVRYAVRAVEAV